MAQQNPEIPGTISQHDAGKPEIDIKRVFYQAVRYWYLVALSLGIFMSVAFLNNRYGQKIYPVSASIIIKETEESGGAELLYKNSLISPYQNYLNELYIIKSYPLIQQVVEDLNFGITFYKEGNILTTETYGDLPFSARVVGGNGSDVRFYFEPVDTNTFQLYPNGSTKVESKDRATFHFEDTIAYAGLKWLFHLEHKGTGVVSEPLILVYQEPSRLTGSYVGKLGAVWAEEGAGVVNLTVNGPNPIKDIDFLNGLIRRYQQYDLDKKNLTASRTIDFIGVQLAEISDSLQRVELILERFKDKNAVTNSGVEAERLLEKVEALDIQKTNFMLRQNYYDYLTKYIRESDNLDIVIAPSSVGLEDNVLGTLVSRMIDLQMQLRMISGGDQLENPLITQRIKGIQE